MKSNNKVEIYKTLNRKSCKTPYLINIKDRDKRMQTEYRVSNHHLQTEVSRHKRTWMPSNKQTCGYCVQDIEH